MGGDPNHLIGIPILAYYNLYIVGQDFISGPNKNSKEPRVNCSQTSHVGFNIFPLEVKPTITKNYPGIVDEIDPYSNFVFFSKRPSLRIQVCPGFRDYPDPLLSFSDGIGTRKSFFHREGSNFIPLKNLDNPYI